MNKLFNIIVALFITTTTFAQAPGKISYQAVVRDSGGKLLVSQSLGMRISILQTSASGTAVYVETHTPSTNANGLVSLEIGAGSVISGDFTSIDWGTDKYFIKTETDPTGGSSYTITGTSQLLSVPYALHAKTAGSVTETQTLADVMVLNNVANNQIKNVTNPTESQDAATKGYVDVIKAEFEAIIAALDSKVTALESNITAQESNITALTSNITALTSNVATLESKVATLAVATIGDLRGGGIVFWVDPADNTHGLVCAIQDQSATKQWYNGVYIITNAIAGIGTGSSNTDAIIAAQGGPSSNYAAGLARGYSSGSYNDWFLPSKDELNQMYINKAVINAVAMARGGTAFSGGNYWSSTESTQYFAWYQHFDTGTQATNNKDVSVRVRAIRAF